VVVDHVPGIKAMLSLILYSIVTIDNHSFGGPR